MNTQLNYIIAGLRSAELHRAAERARPADQALAGRRNLPDPNLITPRAHSPGEDVLAP